MLGNIDHYDLVGWNFQVLIIILIGVSILIILTLKIIYQNHKLLSQKRNFKTKKDTCVDKQYFGFLSKWVKNKPPENCRKCDAQYECSHQQTPKKRSDERTESCKPNQRFGFLKTWPREIPKNCKDCMVIADCVLNKRR